GAKEFNRRVKKLNDVYYGLHKDHFNEPNITKTQQLNKNRELNQNAFVIFTPQNLSAYYATLTQARKKFLEQNEVNIEGLSDELMKSKDIFNKEPYIQYYYNHFYDLQQLKDKIDQVYELEKAKPFKVYISFGFIWQKKKQVYKHQQTLDEYHYSHTRPSADDSYKTLPNTLVRDKQTNDYFKQKAVDLLSDYQDTTHEDSAKLKVALYSFLFVVYRLPLGTKMDKIYQHFNKEGITRNIECDYKICWFIVASFALHLDIDSTCSRISDVIKLFLQYHDINPSQKLNKANKQLLEQYNGFNYVTDLEKYQQMFKLNVITYTCDDKVMETRQDQPEQFSKFEEHIIDKEFQTVNVLLIPLTFVDEIHAMFIIDIDKVINGKLCPNNCQIIINTKNQHYKRDLAKHLKYCQGPETAKQVKLDHLPKPYYPHISNNKLLQKLVATGQQDQLTPTLDYITFDFETVKNIISENNIIAQLESLSVASAATMNVQITTLYFDLRNGTDFIEQWISQLFEVAIRVSDANQSNIPEVQINDKNYIPYKPQVSVIRFNSKKFDMNLLFKHLIKNKTKIQYMGSTTQAKQTVVSHLDYDFDLRFIDILSFIPPNNTQKQFVEKFGTKGIKLTKGISPHGSFNYDNYKLVLSQSEAFTKDDFYDKLNNKNLSNEDYEQYVNDFTNFENRCEYLKHYNIRDVTCMINPINHLIQITWEEKVDMLGCISLAQIASQIKYKYCYGKFDINANYNIVSGFEQFEVTQYWWNNKFKGYINQDEYAKRDTTNNVTEDDFEWISDKVTNETCHLCHNKFTKENKSTLDRIDNSIGHTKQNSLFDKHLGFESFACTMMNKRQDAISQHNDTKSLYYKQILNSAFGGERQNNAKFDKISFNDARHASIKQLNQCHKATRKLSDDILNYDGEVIEEAYYMISESLRQFKCDKPMQEAAFTLDNSKFWYINFVYNFLYKCIDMDRVHFCNMDTDSMYLAIAGSQIEGYKQGLKYVIKDQLFYDQHYKEWLPWDNCTVAEEKKLLGLTTESYGENIVCLAPKCCSLQNGNEQNDDIVSLVNRMKGVSEKKANLTTNDYTKCLNDGCNINVTTNNLQMKMGVKSMISMEKSALTGIHNKMVVLSNGCCAPFMYVINADHYLID
ncbi:MAG: hypothetical protein EZS28_013543, partial [Streblomastix strix]